MAQLGEIRSRPSGEISDDLSFPLTALDRRLSGGRFFAMKKLLLFPFVALLMTGCGSDNNRKHAAAKIRFVKESGSTELELYAHQLTDLTPLANLTDLRVLGLGRNNITDVTPLAELTNLKTLWLPQQPNRRRHSIGQAYQASNFISGGESDPRRTEGHAQEGSSELQYRVLT